MFKRYLHRLLQIPISYFIGSALWLLAILHMLQVYNTYDYGPIPRESIRDELFKGTVPQLPVNKTKPNCTYDDILNSNFSVHNYQVKSIIKRFEPDGIVNGSFTPEYCNPLFSVAILVDYRNRPTHLKTFLPYMHTFLRKQNIHYKIFVIEQQDNKEFNRGLLLNIGARAAVTEKFPCLIVQDVDTLPLDGANLHVCTRSPRHMSPCIDKYRFVRPYEDHAGGELAIRADQYKQVNGFSNKFKNWGGEDDEFRTRLLNNNLTIQRWPMEMSRYTMLSHQKETRNTDRWRIAAEIERCGSVVGDGLDSVQYERLRVRNRQLFVQIAVWL